jgi:hypothetical protein
MSCCAACAAEERKTTCAPCRTNNASSKERRYRFVDTAARKTYAWTAAQLEDTLLESEGWDTERMRQRIQKLAVGKSIRGPGGTLTRISPADARALAANPPRECAPPDADACALGKWAWDRPPAACGDDPPDPTTAARNLANKRWSPPGQTKRVPAKTLRNPGARMSNPEAQGLHQRLVRGRA